MKDIILYSTIIAVGCVTQRGYQSISTAPGQEADSGFDDRLVAEKSKTKDAGFTLTGRIKEEAADYIATNNQYVSSSPPLLSDPDQIKDIKKLAGHINGLSQDEIVLYFQSPRFNLFTKEVIQNSRAGSAMNLTGDDSGETHTRTLSRMVDFNYDYVVPGLMLSLGTYALIKSPNVLSHKKTLLNPKNFLSSNTTVFQKMLTARGYYIVTRLGLTAAMTGLALTTIYGIANEEDIDKKQLGKNIDLLSQVGFAAGAMTTVGAASAALFVATDHATRVAHKKGIATAGFLGAGIGIAMMVLSQNLRNPEDGEFQLAESPDRGYLRKSGEHLRRLMGLSLLLDPKPDQQEIGDQ